MPPRKAIEEHSSSDKSHSAIVGTHHIDTAAVSKTARKIGNPPMRATLCEWTFCTAEKSASSAIPCKRTCLITSRVSRAEKAKLTRNENMITLCVQDSKQRIRSTHRGRPYYRAGDAVDNNTSSNCTGLSRITAPRICGQTCGQSSVNHRTWYADLAAGQVGRIFSRTPRPVPAAGRRYLWPKRSARR